MKNNVLCGVDRVNEGQYADLLKSFRLGLITGPTGLDRNLNQTGNVLRGSFDLRAYYSPEHGLNGAGQAGSHDENYTDEESGLPVYSLYGANVTPSSEYLADIDALVFDIQDVGARFYTYISTLAHSMKACARDRKAMIVLDRPNPVSLGRTEGNILRRGYESFVGMYPIPSRHGMTVGEFAQYINSEHGVGCELHVVPCRGLTRDMYFDDTGLSFVSPSPNIPTVDSALVYLGTCLFEGTNVSEGRGTTHPFEIFGAPWIDEHALCDRMRSFGFEGVLFRRACFTPTFHKFQGEVCRGLQLHITDRDSFRPFEVGLAAFCTIREMYPEQFTTRVFLDHLFGCEKLRTGEVNTGNMAEYLEKCAAECAEFLSIKEKYQLY